MPASARNAKGSLALVMLAALSVTAMAAETSPPAAPAAAPAPSPAAAPSAPTPAAIAAADTILADVGIKQSVSLVVPAMMTELEQNVTKNSAGNQGFAARNPESDQTRIRQDRGADIQHGGDASRAANVRKGDRRRRGLLRKSRGQEISRSRTGLSAKVLRRRRALAR